MPAVRWVFVGSADLLYVLHSADGRSPHELALVEMLVSRILNDLQALDLLWTPVSKDYAAEDRGVIKQYYGLRRFCSLSSLVQSTSPASSPALTSPHYGQCHAP